MQKRNEASKTKKTVLGKKIGAIFSSACGTANTSIAGSRAFNMAFGIGGSGNEREREGENERERERPISTAFNKTHPCDEVQPHAADADATSCLQLACRRRRLVSSGLSGILTSTGLRKWKSSLKKVARVKLRIKTVGNEGKAEAKTELELCKKRILMGEKCRALNHSGVLHYDKQGILLPED